MSKPIQTPISDLRHIRQLMERSRYFIGLSGLSGIGAGTMALLGLAVVLLYRAAATDGTLFTSPAEMWLGNHPWGIAAVPFLFVVGAIVVTGAVASGFYFTHRRVRRLGHPFADPKTYKMLAHLALPLAVGGVFCLALLYHGAGYLIAPATLIFYGLALLNVSYVVSEELRLLAYLEIGLGLVGLFFTQFAIAFWATGFGLLHIGYGFWMYRKYDAHE